jgi:DNA-binding NarL/FixJ family response regulator
MGEKLRVIVVDDHPMFREGVIRTLKENNIMVIGQGASAAEAIRLVQELNPDILLLDIGIPGGGISAAQNVTNMSPTTRVVILTGSEKEDNLLAALHAGARGYALKGVSAPELVKIVQDVASGDVYIHQDLANTLLIEMVGGREKLAQAKSVLDGLSQREVQILELVANGKSNREIGDALHLSENTIKQYMTTLLQKLNVRNRVEAARLIQRRSE